MVSRKNHDKIFIIGLPRTGTTSVCAALLNLQYRVAHTAYTKTCFEQAQVLADTPAFCDFSQLDIHYPNAKFIYLERSLNLWLPSIQQLLQRMYANVVRDDGGFNPIIKRCYKNIFAPFTLDNINDSDFLKQCYIRHQQKVMDYFRYRPDDLLVIDVAHEQSYRKLLTFLSIENTQTTTENVQPLNFQWLNFQWLNKGGKVTAWKAINSPYKVESTQNGRVTELPYQF